MAYVETSLTRTDAISVATNRSISFFHYGTPDAAATVETAGYWNNARKRLSKGDVITAVMAIDGTPVVKKYVITAVPATGNVTYAVQATALG